MKFKVGDWVRHVASEHLSKEELTIGKRYKIEDIDTSTKLVAVKCDDGSKERYFPERFELAEELAIKNILEKYED